MSTVEKSEEMLVWYVQLNTQDTCLDLGADSDSRMSSMTGGGHGYGSKTGLECLSGEGVLI